MIRRKTSFSFPLSRSKLTISLNLYTCILANYQSDFRKATAKYWFYSLYRECFFFISIQFTAVNETHTKKNDRIFQLLVWYIFQITLLMESIIACFVWGMWLEYYWKKACFSRFFTLIRKLAELCGSKHASAICSHINCCKIILSSIKVLKEIWCGRVRCRTEDRS